MKEEWKVYIKGVPERGDEVIKVLTDLGAINHFGYAGTANDIYYINHDGYIRCMFYDDDFVQTFMDDYREIKLSKKWKDGDILIRNDGTDYKVFWEYDSDSYTSFYAHNVSMHVNGTITQYSGSIWHGEKILCFRKDYQLATLSEVERFHELLHKHCKDWDAEKKEVVDWKWEPKEGEEYWTVIVGIANKLKFTWFGTKDDEARYKLGNCFKTREEAEAMAEKVKKLFLQNYEKTKENS